MGNQPPEASKSGGLATRCQDGLRHDGHRLAHGPPLSHILIDALEGIQLAGHHFNLGVLHDDGPLTLMEPPMGLNRGLIVTNADLSGSTGRG